SEPGYGSDPGRVLRRLSLDRPGGRDIGAAPEAASCYGGVAGACHRESKLKHHLGDVSATVQQYVEKNGFNVVREFVGHGIGRELHEEPQVPNYGLAGHGPVLKEGMVLAIEPMVTSGSNELRVLGDNWTAVTLDGGYSAHFEHMVAVTRNGPDVLTRLDA